MTDSRMKDRVKGLIAGTAPDNVVPDSNAVHSDPTAPRQALQVLTLAQRTAEEHLAHAHHDADKIKEDAREAAEQIVRDAQANAHTLRREAEKVLSDARAAAEKIAQDAQKHADDTKRDAEKILADARAAAEATAADAKENADDLKLQAEQRYEDEDSRGDWRQDAGSKKCYPGLVAEGGKVIDSRQAHYLPPRMSSNVDTGMRTFG